MARLQMSGPPVSDGDPTSADPEIQNWGPPLWLRIDPNWQHEIFAYNAANNVNILHWLQIHGRRHRLERSSYRWGLISVGDNEYLEDDYDAEEGYAAETRVR